MCSNGSDDSETLNFWITFLRFLKCHFKKNVKSRVFLGFKKRKNRILELCCLIYDCKGFMWQNKVHSSIHHSKSVSISWTFQPESATSWTRCIAIMIRRARTKATPWWPVGARNARSVGTLCCHLYSTRSQRQTRHCSQHVDKCCYCKLCILIPWHMLN